MPHETALGPIDAAPTSPGPEMTIGAQHNVDQGYYAEGFVAAIAAAAGLDIQWPRLGARIDLCVFLPGPNGTSGSKQMDIQVKSWSTGSVSADGNFHYPLEVPAFNYLAGDGHDQRDQPSDRRARRTGTTTYLTGRSTSEETGRSRPR